MNILSRSPYLRAALLFLLAFQLSSVAQPPPAAEKSGATAPATPPTPADPTTPAAPAPTPSAEKKEEDDRSKLRDISQPEVTAEPDREPAQPRSHRRNGGGNFPFGEHTVPPGSQMREVVSIVGSTTVAGTVVSDAVSVMGNTQILRGGKVGGAAVAVLGRLESEGEIEDEAVSVMGSSTINGPVGGEAVAVFGNMYLGPKAVIGGDVVVVGGRLTKDPNAIVHGNEVRLPILGPFGNLEWLTTWITRCAFYGRLLAFGPHLGWAWAVAFSFLAFYLLLALLFSRGLVKCAETLETKPGYSVLASVLTVLLTPVATVLLAVTVVGALLVPFLAAGLFFAGLFGKAVMLAWIGRRFTKFFGDGPLAHPVFAVLIGGLIVTVLYTVPIAGILTYKLLSWLGLGVVVYTIALSMKRDRPRPPATPTPAPLPPYFPPTPAAPVAAYSAPASFPPQTPPASSGQAGIVSAPMMSAGFSETSGSGADLPRVEAGPAPMPPPSDSGWSSASAPPPVAPSSIPESPPPFSAPQMPPPTSSALPPRTVPPMVVWPRAGFFIRVGALAIDAVLIGLIMAFLAELLPRGLGIRGPGGWLLALATYGALMWKTKGTTIGGIVCGLKVVRVDNREIDWATAIVRALACFLSFAVAGLGFIWVAIDEEKQSWHDKIAGTAVVVVPKGVSLV